MGAIRSDKGKSKEHISHPFFMPKMSTEPSTSRAIVNTPGPTARVISYSTSVQASTARIGAYTVPAQSSSPDLDLQDSRKSSWIWEHGFERPGLWQCAYCPQKYSDKGTSNQQRHLREVHDTHRPNATKTSLPQPNLYNPRRCETIRLRELLVEWIVERRHPFVEVESPAFRNFVEYLNPLAVNKVPKSANTVRADIMKSFQAAKEIVKQSLHTSKFKIHLTFDLWSSPNYKSILAIVGHWTNSQKKVETATLALREILGGHRGAEDLAPVIHDVVKEYGIEHKLGWFMTDNAGNNDTALEGLNELLREDGGDGFDVEGRRLRCLGHVINLAVKLLLWNGKNTDLGKDLQEVVDVVQELHGSDNCQKAKIKEWRARGVVGRLHNIITHIRGSNKRRGEYLTEFEIDCEKIPAFMVHIDNDTRWSSTHNMILSAVKNKERLNYYVSRTSELIDDALSAEDWEDLKEMLELLKPFKIVTMLGQQKGTAMGSVASSLWGYDYLMAQLERWEEKSPRGETGFRAAVNLSWDLLKKYYRETDKAPIYIAGMVLDPRQKMEYFERNWDPEWLGPAKERLRSIYNEYRDEKAEIIRSEPSRISTTTTYQSKEGLKTGGWNSDTLDIHTFLYGDNNERVADELEAYLAERTVLFAGKDERTDFDLTAYWQANSAVYPTLAQMFWDITAVPSMSAEPERVFSG